MNILKYQVREIVPNAQYQIEKVGADGFIYSIDLPYETLDRAVRMADSHADMERRRQAFTPGIVHEVRV